jgi:hypothetical protein
VKLSIEFQYLLTSFGDLQEYIILVFSFFFPDAGRTGHILGWAQLPG